ncbi:hypothetical protein MCOR02_001655 [Pyricularia oryzae]|nr:hypothetical protein MCOR02_001655 [Pyricularia oryzae]KAI6367339.1 hypothetical protein MCOR31_006077 [Pyricularia oryzae]
MHMQFRRKETSITGDDGRIGSTKEAAYYASLVSVITTDGRMRRTIEDYTDKVTVLAQMTTDEVDLARRALLTGSTA